MGEIDPGIDQYSPPTATVKHSWQPVCIPATVDINIDGIYIIYFICFIIMINKIEYRLGQWQLAFPPLCMVILHCQNHLVLICSI